MTMRSRWMAVAPMLLFASMLLPGSALAQSRPDYPSTTQYRQAMQRMHTGMMAESYTNDADRDFVAGMLPHHQGAVDMARVELKYGHDPVLRRLASNIVTDQEREIALMRRWQAEHSR